MRRERGERVDGRVKFDRREIYISMRGDYERRPTRVKRETHEPQYHIRGTTFSFKLFLFSFICVLRERRTGGEDESQRRG